MCVTWYVMQQFHMCLNDKYLLNTVGAENPLLGSTTVLYSCKTIKEKPTIAFVTDQLEQPLECASSVQRPELNVSHVYE